MDILKGQYEEKHFSCACVEHQFNSSHHSNEKVDSNFNSFGIWFYVTAIENTSLGHTV